MKLSIFSNKEFKILEYVFNNSVNMEFIGTQQEIADKLHFSKRTVNEKMRFLKESDFLIIKNRRLGVWELLPRSLYVIELMNKEV